jgi:hypothetical protein
MGVKKRQLLPSLTFGSLANNVTFLNVVPQTPVERCPLNADLTQKVLRKYYSYYEAAQTGPELLLTIRLTI